MEVGKPLEFENFGLRWEHESKKPIDTVQLYEGKVYYTIWITVENYLSQALILAMI